jgi:hypothetical protein
MKEFAEKGWIIFIIFFIIIIWILLGLFFPKFWSKKNPHQKYPDGFSRNIEKIFSFMKKKQFEEIHINIRNHLSKSKIIEWTLEFQVKDNIHIDKFFLRIETWIPSIDQFLEWSSYITSIEIDKNCSPWILESKKFTIDTLQKLEEHQKVLQDGYDNMPSLKENTLYSNFLKIQEFLESPQFITVYIIHNGNDVVHYWYKINNFSIELS